MAPGAVGAKGLVAAHPHLITVSLYPVRVGFFHHKFCGINAGGSAEYLLLGHFGNPFGRDELLIVPFSVLENQLTDFGKILRLKVKSPTTKVLPFFGLAPARILDMQRRKDALIKILSEPKNALVKQYQKLFDMDDVELTFEEDAIQAIADKAFERKTGARGLRSIMESVMMDTMYQIPSDDTIEACVITKGAVDGSSEPLTIHREAMRKAK